MAVKRLLVVSPTRNDHLWIWNGSDLQHHQRADKLLPITTSSYQTEDVIEARRDFFFRAIASGERIGPDFLERYHVQYNPLKAPHSVLMERPDARTVSISRVYVTAKKIQFLYTPKGIGQEKFGKTEKVILER